MSPIVADLGPPGPKDSKERRTRGGARKWHTKCHRSTRQRMTGGATGNPYQGSRASEMRFRCAAR